MRPRRVSRCWSSPVEARLCAGQEVALVGAGNSAGQAVVALASQVAKVWLLVRGQSLDARMSRYLVDRIAGLPNVEVVMQAEVTGLEGHDGALAAIRWRQSGEERSEEHTSELQSRVDLVCRLLLEKKKALSIP